MLHEITNILEATSYDSGDWKLHVRVKTTNDANATRVFLQHNGFREFPVKTSCHATKGQKFFVTILPLNKENQKHVQCEKVKHCAYFAHQNHTFELQCVEDFVESKTIIPIQSSKIDVGSIFVHEQHSVVATLVETLHSELFSTTNQNTVSKPSLSTLTLITSWPTNSSPSSIKQKVIELEQLLNWFDF